MQGFDVVIHLRRCEGRSVATEVGLKLAKRLQAHVLGLHAIPISMAAFASPEGVAVHVSDAQQWIDDAKRREPWWREKLAENGLTGDYQVLQGDSVESLCHASRWCDLIVAERPILNPDAPTGWGIVSRTVFGASAPVVVVPERAKVDNVGEHIVVAWNGSREANLAVRGALPLLQHADRVTVLEGEISADPFGLNALPAFNLRAWLARRGVDATYQAFRPEKDHGAAVLNAARDVGGDMIVTGAWGHSRIAELVLGGVTRHLFQNSELPLIVAH
jgi:nucleotide-binding universal stress UspA family protein